MAGSEKNVQRWLRLVLAVFSSTDERLPLKRELPCVPQVVKVHTHTGV